MSYNAISLSENNCSYSNEVWRAVTFGLLCDQYTSEWMSLQMLQTGNLLSMTQRFLLRYVLQTSTHTIWRERNAWRHGEGPIPASTLIKQIDKTTRNRLVLIQNQGDHMLKDALQLCGLPPESKSLFVFFNSCSNSKL